MAHDPERKRLLTRNCLRYVYLMAGSKFWRGMRKVERDFTAKLSLAAKACEKS